MLSLFPELLFLSPFAAFLIRIAVAATVALMGSDHVRQRDMSYLMTLGGLEILLALMLFVGFYTQAAALTVFVLASASLFMPSVRAMPRSTLALVAVMCLTLLLTGSGPFAFDLPL